MNEKIEIVEVEDGEEIWQVEVTNGDDEVTVHNADELPERIS